jgi:hypothetical protein
MARSAVYRRYPQHPVYSGHRLGGPRRLDTPSDSQSLLFASKFAPFSRDGGAQTQLHLFIRQRKVVQPLTAWQRCSSKRLALSGKTLCFFQQPLDKTRFGVLLNEEDAAYCHRHRFP